MKKIFFTLIAFIVAIVASAQEKIIKVYEYDDRGELITTPVYQSTRKVKVVFEEKALSVSGNVDGYDYVDLGLPSKTLWATYNVGASRPEEYGDYFAWGETEPKNYYDWSSYKWCNGTNRTLTKYCDNSSYGTVDYKTELDLEDDAAYVNWGESWRMPTEDQMEELMLKCTWTWTTNNGVKGNLVTGPNGNTIFLPAAGIRSGGLLSRVGSNGLYWTRTLITGDPYSGPDGACGLSSDSGNPAWSYSDRLRCFGQSIRPVRASKI